MTTIGSGSGRDESLIDEVVNVLLPGSSGHDTFFGGNGKSRYFLPPAHLLCLMAPRK